MTRNQIIAKAMLSGLGIYAVVSFSSALVYNLRQVSGSWGVFANIFLLVAMLLLVGRFMIFKNDGFACRIAGDGRDASQFDRQVYLIKTFRIAFVIIGLSLLSYYRTWTTVIELLQAFSLPQIRLWMRNSIYNRSINFPSTSLMVTWEVLKLLLIVYLLGGGSKLIDWHLKNSNLNNKNEDIVNE